LKGPYPISLSDEARTRFEPSRICFLRVGIANHGRTTAQDCRVSADLARPRTAVGMFVYDLRWERESTQMVFDKSNIRESVLEAFPEKRADIEVGPGRILNILFATEDSKAFFVSEREKSVDVPSKTDLVLKAVGPRFVVQKLGRFRISIRSWDGMGIMEVTLSTRLEDMAERIVAYLKQHIT